MHQKAVVWHIIQNAEGANDSRFSTLHTPSHSGCSRSHNRLNVNPGCSHGATTSPNIGYGGNEDGEDVLETMSDSTMVDPDELWVDEDDDDDDDDRRDDGASSEESSLYRFTLSAVGHRLAIDRLQQCILEVQEEIQMISGHTNPLGYD